MFRGTHLTRLDDKGRLKVPAEFKRLIDERYGANSTSQAGTARVPSCIPWKSGRRSSASWRLCPASTQPKQKLLKRTSYYGQTVEFDGQGRLLLPQIIRESADLRGEVAVGGRLTHLEVANAEALRKEVQEPFTTEDEEILGGLGSSGAVSGSIRDLGRGVNGQASLEKRTAPLGADMAEGNMAMSRFFYKRRSNSWPYGAAGPISTQPWAWAGTVGKSQNASAQRVV